MNLFSFNIPFNAKIGWKWIVELSVGVLIILAIQRYFFPEDIGFLNIHPHPFWIISFYIIARRNFQESMISLAILSGIYFLFLMIRPTPFYYSSLTLIHDLKEPILFLAIGGIMSDIITKTKERLEKNKEKLAQQSNEINTLEKTLITQRALNHRLEQLLAWETIDMLQISQALITLSKQDKKIFFKQLHQLLLETTPIKDCHIITVSKNKLISHIKGDKEIIPEDDPIVMEVFRSKKAAALPEMDNFESLKHLRDYTIAAAPIIKNDELVAIICITDITFVEFTAHFFELFKTIITNTSQVYDS